MDHEWFWEHPTTMQGSSCERCFQRHPKGDALRKFENHRLPQLRSWRRALQPWFSKVRPRSDRASKNRNSQCSQKRSGLGLLEQLLEMSEFWNGYVSRWRTRTKFFLKQYFEYCVIMCRKHTLIPLRIYLCVVKFENAGTFYDKTRTTLKKNPSSSNH